jgi:hypothetical protein
VRLLRVITGVTGQRERRGLREEEGIDADMWAHAVGETGEGGGGTVSGVHVAGLRGYSSAGPNRSPRPFIPFFLFCFSFSIFRNQICFQIFCKLFQFKPNKFLVLSNIHSSVLNH